MTDTKISVVTAGAVHVPPAEHYDVVATADTGHEAVARALIEVPDVLVLDAAITEPDAPAVCRRVREWAPATRILATREADDDQLYATLLAGATATTRPDPGEAGWATVLTAVAHGESLLRPRLAARILHDIDTWSVRRGDPLNPPPSLTETEREVLQRLAADDSAATIATEHGVTERLVNLHAAYAVAKLHRHVYDAETLSAYRG